MCYVCDACECKASEGMPCSSVLSKLMSGSSPCLACFDKGIWSFYLSSTKTLDSVSILGILICVIYLWCMWQALVVQSCWSVVSYQRKEQCKCVWMECGVVCVTTAGITGGITAHGITRMHLWSADNLDIQLLVRMIKVHAQWVVWVYVGEYLWYLAHVSMRIGWMNLLVLVTTMLPTCQILWKYD